MQAHSEDKPKRVWCDLCMSIATQHLGQQGEARACAYLASRNFEIRERNVRFGRYEIDIVAYDTVEKMIVFVEVKTRSRSSTAYPIRTAVDPRKRRAMREALFRWLVAHEYEGAARIDLVCITKDRVTEHIMDVGSDFF